MIAVTHSPLVRAVGVACGDEDAGEPAHLSGYLLAARTCRATETPDVTGTRFDPFSDSLDAALRRTRPLVIPDRD
jgi:hypothetical protein